MNSLFRMLRTEFSAPSGLSYFILLLTDVDSQERVWLAGLGHVSVLGVGGASLWLAISLGPYKMREGKMEWYRRRGEGIPSSEKQKCPWLRSLWSSSHSSYCISLLGDITSWPLFTLQGPSSGNSPSLQLSLMPYRQNKLSLLNGPLCFIHTHLL